MTKANSDGQATEGTPAVGLTADRREELSAAWDHVKASDEPEPTADVPPVDEVTPEPDGTEPEPVVGSDPDPDGEKDPDPPKDDELDHGEKSRLGRRVKRLQDQLEERDRKLDDMTSKIDRLTGFIEAQSGGGIQETGPVTVDDLDDDALLTAADYKRLREAEQREAMAANNSKEQQQKAYENGYYEAILAYEDDPDFDQIYELLTAEGSEFNRKLSEDNPASDVRLNIAEARLRVATAKANPDDKNPNLQGRKAEGAGVGGDGKVPDKEPVAVDLNRLSSEAQELLKHVKRKGRDPQAIADRALGGQKK